MSEVPRWVGVLRVADYALLGGALVLTVTALVRHLRTSVASETRPGRESALIAALVSLVFLLFVIGGLLGLSERVSGSQPFNWRDWFVALQFALIILADVLIVRTERRWNPDRRPA